MSFQLSEQDKVLSPERVDSIDSTKVDFTFILKVTNSFFKNFQTHLYRNDVLSSNTVPNESNKYSIRSLWVPNYRGADFTQTLPCQRGLKLAPLNFSKLTTHIDELRILLTDNDIDIF